MKTILLFLLLLPLSLQGEMREAATKTSIAAQREALSASRGESLVAPAREVVTVETTSSDSIMDSSSYLVGPRGFTLIPKGCAFCVGSDLQLVQEVPVGLPYQDWSRFMRGNGARLRAIQVQPRHLEPEADLKFITQKITASLQSGMNCVTILNGRPVRISIEPQQLAINSPTK